MYLSVQIIKNANVCGIHLIKISCMLVKYVQNSTQAIYIGRVGKENKRNDVR